MSLIREEWPRHLRTGKSVLHFMTESIFDTAVEFRKLSGARMKPSPNVDAQIRFKFGGSQHCVGTDGKWRKATATDLFILDDHMVAHAWLTALSMRNIVGLGVYFDTYYNGRKVVLIHIDERASNPVRWVCPSKSDDDDPRVYIYAHDDPVEFIGTLGDELRRLKK